MERPDMALQHSENRQPVILLVAFGTTIAEALAAFDRIDRQARLAFPEAEVRWAYTSKIVRRKLAARGTILDSPEIALARLMDEGHREVGILSLHVFPGREFHDLHHNVRLFSRMAKGFERVRMAMPLLSSHQDLTRAAEALVRSLPAERTPDEAVLFVGHGNRAHPSDVAYTAMEHLLQKHDPRLLVGTIQGEPGLQDVIAELGRLGVTKAWLAPFMAVAGEHARTDMAGQQPGSWQSQLAAHGIMSRTVLRGLVEIPEVADIWLDHLREVFPSAKGGE